MPIRCRPVGTTAGTAGQGPRRVDAYELDGGGGLRAVVWTYGATLAELWVPDGAGGSVNVAVGFPDLAGYESLKNPYLGATLGRFSRNVGHGRFRLDGVEYQLDLNDRGHHMHGGREGFSRLVWEAEPDPATMSLTLRLVSPDGDQGYPGELSAETVYRLGEHGIEFEHRATTTAPTVVDLTNHTYWNLAGGGTIDGHTLRIGGTRAIRFGERMVPVPGPPEPLRGTEHDFTRPRPLRGTAIDRFFVLDGPVGTVELAHPASGRAMRVTTDAPGTGVYTADRFARPRSGICLQTSALPDAPNRPDFPSVRLDPGQVYRSRTVHEFTAG
ncbi:galactose mutarotase [Kitasatospora sp. MMS16-BH015]|uniref:aldose epimerase family protein n=1 Tax=Kitasatospora sp. MMS16-BH015 TaxID=2018025 RepID=UPI000CA1D994|nr:aldose epimerase family protein [Kitasatospora sp. MMS16-BH015]AUG77887.1 galactose mutarotase [Kitasatospora sp. MMS16-BH015]